MMFGFSRSPRLRMVINGVPFAAKPREKQKENLPASRLSKWHRRTLAAGLKGKC